MAVIRLEPPQATQPVPQGLPLLRLGFRPFYLLAAGFAVLAIPYWMLQFAGVALPTGPLHGMLWHAHEMLFGFAVAVIAGFLLTAVRAWTGLPTPTGLPLAGLALLWLAGRIGLLVAPAVVGTVIDSLFLPALAATLARPLWRARNRRNYFVPLLILGLAACNVGFHLAWTGKIALNPLTPLVGVLYLVTALEMIIAGRVVPMFTRNAQPEARQFRIDWIERSIVPASLFVFALNLFVPQGWIVAVLNLAVALLHAVRLFGWGGLATGRQPILWILHVSYLWIPIAFITAAAAVLGHAPWVAVHHLLAVGALSGLVIGMITRTALGHTGRPLRVDNLEMLAYWALAVAALLRIVPLLVPSGMPYLSWLLDAALCWEIAFICYLIKYTPMLCRPRVDGKPG